jgi:RIO kinase 1
VSYESEQPKKSRQSKKIKKQSYESNRDVQRWLHTQRDELAIDEVFDPTFLASRRDSDWILSSLAVFFQQKLILDVISQASSGKEATVYCCIAHPDTGAEYLAAKVYRPRMFRSLSNDAIYRESRAAVDHRGRARGARARRESAGNTARARAQQVSSWIQTEYAVQSELHAAGARVPQPFAQIGNAILMEWIGQGDQPAPRLSDVDPEPDEAATLFRSLIDDIGLFLANHRIHGDLSPYNVLYLPGQATVIDFAQMVDPRYNPDIYELLVRDVARICTFFARYGVASNPDAIAADLWTRYMTGELTR